MNITLPEIKVAGYYTFILNGAEVFSAPAKNLITDFGWNRLINLTTQLQTSAVLQLGTGNTPPAVTDTALVALLASRTGVDTNTAINGSDTIGTYRGRRYTFAFPQGAVIGNVAEVGFKVATGDSSLTSRSLVKDGLGNPAVITVTAIDQLTVLYEHRFYLNRTLSTSGTTLVAGVSTNWAIQAGANDIGIDNGTNISGYRPVRIVALSYGNNFVMGSVGNDPTGTNSAVTKSVTGVSINSTLGTIALTYSYTTAEANQTGGVFGLLFWFDDGNFTMAQVGKYKASFSPAIAKNNTKTLAFTFTFTFSRL